MSESTFDVRFWTIDVRRNRRTPYRVRWVVAGQTFSDSFSTMELADSFRARLKTLARRGEAFDAETGLPESMLRRRRDVSFLDHAREYVAFAWPDAAAKSRVSIIETLSRVVPVLAREVPGTPDPAVLRRALWKNLNQG